MKKLFKIVLIVAIALLLIISGCAINEITSYDYLGYQNQYIKCFGLDFITTKYDKQSAISEPAIFFKINLNEYDKKEVQKSIASNKNFIPSNSENYEKLYELVSQRYLLSDKVLFPLKNGYAILYNTANYTFNFEEDSLKTIDHFIFLQYQDNVLYVYVNTW